MPLKLGSASRFAQISMPSSTSITLLRRKLCILGVVLFLLISIVFSTSSFSSTTTSFISSIPTTNSTECIFITTLCPLPLYGPTNQHISLTYLLAFARHFAKLGFDINGQRYPLHCSKVRFGLPKMCMAGDWKTGNLDVGSVFDIEVEGLEQGSNQTESPWVFEKDILRELFSGPEIPTVDCLVDNGYIETLNSYRSDHTLANEEFSVYNRKVDYYSDIYEDKFRCERYFGINYGRLTGTKAVSEKRHKTYSGGRTILGIPLPSRLFFAPELVRFGRYPDFDRQLPIHPWISQYAIGALRTALDQRSRHAQSFGNLTELSKFIVHRINNSNHLLRQGLSQYSVRKLQSLSSCLNQSTRHYLTTTAPIQPFLAFQFRLTDLTAHCPFRAKRLASLGFKEACGVNFTALPNFLATELEGYRTSDVRIVVATDGAATDRKRIRSSFPSPWTKEVVFLDISLWDCEGSPIAQLLPGLATQIALSCAEKIYLTAGSSYSRMIGEFAQSAICERFLGRPERYNVDIKPLPGNYYT